MIICYDTEQFPDVKEECPVNSERYPLFRDIIYVPLDRNMVIFLDDEEYLIDWKVICEHYYIFFAYFLVKLADSDTFKFYYGDDKKLVLGLNDNFNDFFNRSFMYLFLNRF